MARGAEVVILIASEPSDNVMLLISQPKHQIEVAEAIFSRLLGIFSRWKELI